MTVLAPEEKITKAYVQQRIKDWKRRLKELFAQLEKWTPKDIKHDIGEIEQLNEELMRQVEVKPIKLPTYQMFRDKRRLAFMPSALWIVGADGRVNISANNNQYILVDVRENHEGPSDWQIATNKVRNATIPFTRTVFRNLIKDNL